MKKIPIIVDCDPGYDDAIALILACASEKLDLLAVTAVAGNQTLENTLRNAKQILSFIGKRPPVAAGAAKPLVRELQTAPEVHGKNGLNVPELPDPSNYQEEPVPAWELTRKLVLESPNPVTLVPLGPLTNIATLLTLFPEVKQNIARISLMGGSLCTGGNWTSAAEFNIFVDPEAAEIVFSSGLPITMCGLDVTNKALFFPEEAEALRETGRAGRFAATLIDSYFGFYRKQGFKGTALHDPCVVAAIIAPDIFQTKDFHVDIETKGSLTRGMTLADLRACPPAGPNVTAYLDLDRPAFIRLIHDACASYG